MRAWQPAPIFLPGESHGQRSLTGYGPWGHKESDTTEVTKHVVHKQFILNKLFVFISPTYLQNFYNLFLISRVPHLQAQLLLLIQPLGGEALGIDLSIQ